jgi:2-amino-4-hydroxy-6-hydroxymethyldihydropteridine diphosphokinase
MTTPVWLALGSNIGDRAASIHRAIQCLKEHLDSLVVSSLYESPALLPAILPKGAGEEWNLPFLNAVIGGETLLTPLELLDTVKEIEQQIGRQHRGHWSPREIDIDILLYGDECVASERLTIPHAFMLTRDFVLLPLAEIAGELRHPQTHQRIADAAAPFLSSSPIRRVGKMGLSAK